MGSSTPNVIPTATVLRDSYFTLTSCITCAASLSSVWKEGVSTVSNETLPNLDIKDVRLLLPAGTETEESNSVSPADSMFQYPHREWQSYEYNKRLMKSVCILRCEEDSQEGKSSTSLRMGEAFTTVTDVYCAAQHRCGDAYQYNSITTSLGAVAVRWKFTSSNLFASPVFSQHETASVARVYPWPEKDMHWAVGSEANCESLWWILPLAIKLSYAMDQQGTSVSPTKSSKPPSPLDTSNAHTHLCTMLFNVPNIQVIVYHYSGTTGSLLYRW